MSPQSLPPNVSDRSVGVYILIAAGALMMIVGFLGCCGAIKESPCMLGLVSVPSVQLSDHLCTCHSRFKDIYVFALQLQTKKGISEKQTSKTKRNSDHKLPLNVPPPSLSVVIFLQG